MKRSVVRRRDFPLVVVLAVLVAIIILVLGSTLLPDKYRDTIVALVLAVGFLGIGSFLVIRAISAGFKRPRP